VIGEAEGVIAGACGDHAAPLAVRGEAQKGVAGPAFLEGACALEIVEFAEDTGSGDFAKWDRFRAGGLYNAARDPLSRRLDVG
jgi:hypothetical protein